MRPTDLAPSFILDELRRLATLDKHWVHYETIGDGKTYQAKNKIETWLRRYWYSGADAFGLLALSRWLIDGPKVFYPTLEQCEALENVEVRLTLEEYSQPYPAIAIVLPKGKYGPFDCVLCYKDERGILICTLNSGGAHTSDITTTVNQTSDFIELSLQKFDVDCQVDAPTASRALRVACNACLALSHYENHMSFLFPKEIERDRRLAQENSERGKKARERLHLAVRVISFDQEVKLHRVQNNGHTGESTGTGNSKPPHWRKGHWAMQAHGPGMSLRKRILRPPVLVRADLFFGDLGDTSTTYK